MDTNLHECALLATYFKVRDAKTYTKEFGPLTDEKMARRTATFLNDMLKDRVPMDSALISDVAFSVIIRSTLVAENDGNANIAIASKALDWVVRNLDI